MAAVRAAALRRVIAVGLCCALLPCAVMPAPKGGSGKRAAASEQRAGPLYASRPDVLRAAADIAARRDLDPAWVRRTLAKSRYLPQIARWVLPAPAGTAKNWSVYRSRFIDPVRIAAGVAFWQANAATLERAERDYGVPPEIVVGIIGVETIYGRDSGNFRVMDALATLSFDFPQDHPRATERRVFFQAELEQLLSLAHRAGADPFSYKGSYAGAMGMPQFMPSSWARYAIDYDGDGRIDLFRSSADAIGSVANYFKTFGWQPGMQTHYPVRFEPSRLDLEGLLAPDILPTFSVASLEAKGALPGGEAATHKGPLALIELQNGDAAPSYVVGSENFYVITRYNWSSYYAMAVIELGREVAAARTR